MLVNHSTDLNRHGTDPYAWWCGRGGAVRCPSIPIGAPDYAGYCMAAASFLAFVHALNRGAHIRVSLLLNVMSRFRRVLEIWCFAVGAAASCNLAWYAVKATQWSHKFNDISQGQDATPLWIPQLGMSIGAVLLAICFCDNLLRLIILKKHGIVADVVARH